jgi:multiple sugar transport system permease protein
MATEVGLAQTGEGLAKPGMSSEEGRPKASTKIREDRLVRWLSVLPLVGILLCIAVFPMVNSIWNSLNYYPLGGAYRMRFIGLDNYGYMFTQDSLFWNSMRLTVVYSVVAVGAQFLIGFGISLLMDRPMRGIGLLRTLFVVPILISPVVAGLTWRYMYEPSGIINYLLHLVGIPKIGWIDTTTWALPSVIVTDVWQWTPFFVLVLLAGIQAVPREIVEAAALDGLSGRQYLFKMLLPLIKQVALVVLLIRMMDTIRIFDTIFILTGGGPGTATMVASVYAYVKFFKAFDAGYASALSWVVLILVNIFALILLRFLAQEETREQKGLAAA